MNKTISLFDAEHHMHMLAGTLTMVIEHMNEYEDKNHGDFRGLALCNALCAANMQVKKFYTALDSVKKSKGMVDDVDYTLHKVEAILAMSMHYAGRFFYGGSGCIEANFIHQCIGSMLDRVDSIKVMFAAVEEKARAAPCDSEVLTALH